MSICIRNSRRHRSRGELGLKTSRGNWGLYDRLREGVIFGGDRDRRVDSHGSGRRCGEGRDLLPRRRSRHSSSRSSRRPGRRRRRNVNLKPPRRRRRRRHRPFPPSRSHHGRGDFARNSRRVSPPSRVDTRPQIVPIPSTGIVIPNLRIRARPREINLLLLRLLMLILMLKLMLKGLQRRWLLLLLLESHSSISRVGTIQGCGGAERVLSTMMRDEVDDGLEWVVARVLAQRGM